jgi:putative transcriptional regulator
MIPKHHPSESLLMDYAAGTLDAARELVIGAHVASCETCAQEIALMETVGGAMLESLQPAPTSPEALAMVLGRIERPEPASPPPVDQKPDWIRVPSAVLEAAKTRRRWAAPGVWVAPITGDRKGVRAYLLRIGKGMSVPYHTHRGAELVVVLKGAYADGDTCHRAGDFAENALELVHQPEATRDGECICLIAADGALVPRDWIGRLFQPFVGI